MDVQSQELAFQIRIVRSGVEVQGLSTKFDRYTWTRRVRSPSLLKALFTSMIMNASTVEDAFVNVMFQEERNGETFNKGRDSFYDKFIEQGKL